MPLLGAKKYQCIDDWLLPYLGKCVGDKMVVFTDGACSDQGRLDLARAGYGVFYGDGHPWNESFILHGCYQASDRAELAAVTRVLVMQSGEMPIWIKSDNESVVNTANDILVWMEGLPKNGFRKPKIKHNRDLWQIFEEEARNIGTKSITISWVKGHVTNLMVREGGYTQEDKDGNDGADELARKSRDTIPINR